VIFWLLLASCWGQEQDQSRSFKVASAIDRIRNLHIVVNPKQPLGTIDEYQEIVCQLRGLDVRPFLLKHKQPAKVEVEDYSAVIVEFYLKRSLSPFEINWEDPDFLAAIRWMPKRGLISWVKGPVETKADWVPLPCTGE